MSGGIFQSMSANSDPKIKTIKFLFHMKPSHFIPTAAFSDLISFL